MGVRMYKSLNGHSMFGFKKFFQSVLLVILALLVSVFSGLLIGAFNTGFALKLILFLLFPFGIMLLWLLPDSQRTPMLALNIGFCISVALYFIWPRFAYFDIPAMPTQHPQRMVFILLLAFWLYSIATSKTMRETLIRRLAENRVLAMMIGAFFILRLFSSLFSSIPFYSISVTLKELFDYLLVYLLVLSFVQNIADVNRLLRWLVVVTLVVCIMGIVEYKLGHNLFTKFIDASQGDDGQYLQRALMDKVRAGGYRIQASFNHPLLFAEFLICMLPFVIYRFIAGKAWERLLVAITIIMIGPVMWATHTRSAFAALAIVAVGFLFLLLYRAFTVKANQLRLLSIIFIILPVLLTSAAFILNYLGELVLGRTAEEFGSSFVRVLMLQRGIPLVLDSLWVGYGPGLGSYTLNFGDSTGALTLDNYYLQLALESGMPGLLAFLGLLAWGVVSSMTRLSRACTLGELALHGGFALSLLAFAAICVVLGTQHNFPLMFILLGLIVASRDRNEPSLHFPSSCHAKS